MDGLRRIGRERLSVQSKYQKRYESGKTPWDTGKPDFNLIEIVEGRPIKPCEALDVGCGTGDNAIWLAGQGFTVVATDSADLALEKAREKASSAGVECDFRLLDFLEEKIEEGPFGFIFDRGCFHSYASKEERDLFARSAAEHLEKAGLWLTLAGNADEVRKGPGPPQRSAADIILAAEPYFEILELKVTRFGSNSPTPPRAWRCLMRKRSL